MARHSPITAKGKTMTDLEITKNMLKEAQEANRVLEWQMRILQAWKDGALAIKHILETASK